MALGTFVFNVAKGRVAELANRVDVGDPSAARLVAIPILAAGIESDATLIDKLTVSSLLSGATDEATATGWVRKTIAAADITAVAPDTANDRMDIIIGDITWTAVTAGTLTGLVIAYSPADASTAGDAANIPLTAHAWAITPDGSDVTADVAATGFYRAS
jgi:hypothetical protein